MPLFEETMKDVKEVLVGAKLDKTDISEVVLVGGSSRIPKLQSMLSEFFEGKLLNKSVNPDEVVACGAAVQAAILNNDQHESVRDLLLMDVNPLSLGIMNYGQSVTSVIERNTQIPIKNEISYATALDNQTSIQFKVFEGELNFSLII